MTNFLSYGPFISLNQAKAQGLKQYFTGKSCKYGHVSLRRVTGAACLECEAMKREGGAGAAAKRRYKAKRRQLTPWVLAPSEYVKIEQVYAECRRLTEETGELHHVDHIIPLAKGGLHCFENLQILTAKVNQRKSDKLIDVSDQQKLELGMICDGRKAPRKAADWSTRTRRMNNAAADRHGVPRKVWACWTAKQRVQFSGAQRHNGITYGEFAEGLKVFGGYGRIGLMICNAKRVGVSMTEWKSLTKKQRHAALKRSATSLAT